MNPSHSGHSARHQRPGARSSTAVWLATGPRRHSGLAFRLGWMLALGVALATTGALLTSDFGHTTASLSATSNDVPLLGTSVSAGNDSQLARNTAEFGHLPIVRVYYTGLPAANAWTTGVPAAAKAAVIVSFNAKPAAILSGADDAALSHFFDTAPTGHPIYYSYVHEPEHEIVRHEFTTTAYKAAWARVVALADQAHNPDLHSTLILMSYDLNPYSHRDWKSYLPGGGIISTLGWDAYPDHGRKAEPPAEFMAPAVAASKSVGMPFGFAEFGMSTATGRAGWISGVGNYLMGSGALFGTLFDSAVVHPSMLVSDPASISTWRRFVQASDDVNINPPPNHQTPPTQMPPPSRTPPPTQMPPPTQTPPPSSSDPAPATSQLSGLPAAQVMSVHAPSWAVANAQVGPLTGDRIYFPGAVPSRYSGLCAALPAGVTCIISYNKPTQNVAGFIASIPSSRTVYIAYSHEPEAQHKWPSGAAFVAAFDAQSAIIRKAADGRSNIHIASISSSYHYAGNAAKGIGCSYIPAASEVTDYLVDNYQPYPTSAGAANDPGLESWLKCVAGRSRPVGIAEYGVGTCNGAGAQVAALKADDAYFKSTAFTDKYGRLALWSYWDTNKGSNLPCYQTFALAGAMVGTWRSIVAGN